MAQNPTIAVFDLDHTITKKDTYLWFLIEILKNHPRRLLRATWLPLAVLVHKSGIRDNTWLKEVFLNTIAGGLNENQIKQCRDQFLAQLMQRGLHQDALGAISTHKKQQHLIILVSASFDFYVENLATRLGFDKVLCTRSLWKNQILQGRIDGKNCYGQEKIDRLNILFKESNLTPPYCLVAYSDHHSDLPLLSIADRAYAVNPTTKLLKLIKGDTITHVNWK